MRPRSDNEQTVDMEELQEPHGFSSNGQQTSICFSLIETCCSMSFHFSGSMGNEQMHAMVYVSLVSSMSTVPYGSNRSIIYRRTIANYYGVFLYNLQRYTTSLSSKVWKYCATKLCTFLVDNYRVLFYQWIIIELLSISTGLLVSSIIIDYHSICSYLQSRTIYNSLKPR